MSGRAGRAVAFGLLVAALAGCGSGSPTAPSPSGGPSASVAALGEDELAVCDGTLRMIQGATTLRQVRLRQGAAARLGSALDTVVEGQQLVLEYAPPAMRARVRTLGFAVTNVTIAIEDFQTTNDYAEAADNVRRRTTALRRAIDSFRAFVGCPAPGADGPAPAVTEPLASAAA